MGHGPFQVIGIPREGRSPENPSERSMETDARVSLVPSEVRQLTQRGLRVYVERGAGEGIGFTGDDFKRPAPSCSPNRSYTATKICS